MIKIDLVKEDKNYYSAKVNPEIRRFNSFNYLAVLGKGEPAGKEFTKAVEALYPLAYGIRKIYKLNKMVFSVPKLEGLWWVNSDKPALEVPKKDWCWKLLIRMPDFVSKNVFEQAKIEVIKKKKIELINKIVFENINEEKCIQILHVGPYSTEPETLKKIDAFIKDNKLVKKGLHHEIYISDPRKTEDQKMKTILRQPVK